MSGHSLELDVEHIDDVLYFVRTNDQDELQPALTQLAQHHGCTPGQVLIAAIDPQSRNGVLHFSSANGFADLTKNLLQSIADSEATKPFVNHVNKEGNTALHWAALNGHLPVVQLLLEAGADMWLKNSSGHLAMFEAERAEKSEVVQYLLQAGGKEVERTGVEGEADDDEISAEASSSQAD